MPSVCVYFDPQVTTAVEGVPAFAEALASLIETSLGVGPEKIQIMSLAMAHPPVGRSVYIEIKARDKESRSDDLLNAFIAKVDGLSRARLGVVCRIRYTRVPEGVLVAAN